MAKDFTVATYSILLKSLSEAGYSFTTVAGHENSPASKLIILRHDVDASPLNSVKTARIERESGIVGTYYFRYRRRGFEVGAIKEIARLGHEIGYHYEDLSVVVRKAKKGDDEYEIALAAYRRFRENLQKIRGITQVNTICMHGSPLSSSDNRLLWKYFDYTKEEIVVEPYMNISFEDMLYLTDTGRRWDGSSFSVRDKAEDERAGQIKRFDDWTVIPLSGSLMNMTANSAEMQSQYRFRSTFDIINAAHADMLPKRIMMTVHPQRWIESYLPWIRELVVQNVKNRIKYLIIRH